MSDQIPEAVRRTHAFTRTLADIETEKRVKKQHEAEKRGEEVTPSFRDVEVRQIVVYVCPTPGCPDYFGHTRVDLDRPASARTEDRHAIREEMGTPEDEVASRHTRAECPTCRARGRRVERIRVTATAFVPVTEG